VIAADRGLDHARAVAFLAAAHERQERMTRVRPNACPRVINERRPTRADGRAPNASFTVAHVPRERRANHRAQFLLASSEVEGLIH
jgi:hypothetical protein